MTRLLRHASLARMVLALGFLALCGDMAAPALASALRAGMAMPCHEAANASVGLAEAGPHSGGTHVAADTVPQPDRSAPPKHLCCILACLVMAPGVERADAVPAALPASWDGLAVHPLAGRAPPVLLPPPRLFS